MPNQESKEIHGYKIIKEIGSGGMGTVFVVVKPSLEPRVLKKLNPVLSKHTHINKEIQREVAILSRLKKYEHIVEVIDYFEEDGVFYIVMEYVEGESLADYIKRYGPFSDVEAARYFKQVLDAITYAHSKDIIHHDIKPGNILLSEKNIIKVVDFGISRIIDQNRPDTKHVYGTPEYIAPEQAQGKIDRRSDIYSLGITFYEMLTGRVPIQGKTPYTTQKMHEVAEFPSLNKYNPKLSYRLDEIIMKATEKNPEDRYQTAEDFKKDIQDYLDNHQRYNRPPSPPLPMEKPVPVFDLDEIAEKTPKEEPQELLPDDQASSDSSSGQSGDNNPFTPGWTVPDPVEVSDDQPSVPVEKEKPEPIPPIKEDTEPGFLDKYKYYLILLSTVLLVIILIIIYFSHEPDIDESSPIYFRPPTTSCYSAQLGWNDVDGASIYEIYRGSDRANLSLVLKTNKAEYFDETLDSEKKYLYQVIAKSESGDTLAEGIQSIVPKPLDLSLDTLVTATDIQFDWNQIDGVDKIDIYRESGSTNRNVYSGAENSYIDRGLASNTTYRYRFKLTLGNSVEKEGGTYSIKTHAAISVPQPLRPPFRLKITESGENFLSLSWRYRNETVESVILQRRISPGGEFEVVGQFPKQRRSYRDNGLQLDQAYQYRLISVFQGRESEPSVSITYTPTVTILSPLNPAARLTGNKEITISWDKPSGPIDKFILKRKGPNDLGSQPLVELNPGQTEYTDPNLTPGVYEYQILSGFEGKLSSPAVVTQNVSLNQSSDLEDAIKLYNAGDYEAAKIKFENIARVKPASKIEQRGDYFRAIKYLGLIALKMNDPQKALEYFTEAENIYPYSADIHYNKGIAYSSDKIRNYEKAAEHLEKVYTYMNSLPNTDGWRILANTDYQLFVCYYYIWQKNKANQNLKNKCIYKANDFMEKHRNYENDPRYKQIPDFSSRYRDIQIFYNVLMNN